ncbi:MAG: hypothetical protein KBT20_03590 [Bacteroidales bacterium]|nr:hypothetical protein [Candidatus Liminaster caballi]
MRKLFLSLATLVSLGAFVACDDDDVSYAAISGRVSENVVSLKGGVTYLGGITVSLYKGENEPKTLVGSKRTAADGSYAFTNLTRGQYTVSFASDQQTYMPVDTTLNLFNLTPYVINAKMHYNLLLGNGIWKSNDNALTLSLTSNSFHLYDSRKSSNDPYYYGFYSVNDNYTTLFFDYYEDKANVGTFEADYIGEGAIYMFLPEEINGKNRYIFYKDN